MASAVRVEGHIELRRALKNYAPELAKESRKEIGAALIPIVNEARGYVPPTSPMSGWAARPMSEARFPFFNAATMRGGIGYQTAPAKANRFGWSALARIENKSRVGAIYDTAGRKTSGSGSGVKFISNMGALFGRAQTNEDGRLIFRAWARNEGKAVDAYFKAITSANAKFAASTSSNRIP